MLVFVVCLLVCPIGGFALAVCMKRPVMKSMLGFHLGQRPWFIPSLQYCWMSYTKPHSLNIYRDSIWYINLQRLYLVLKKKKINDKSYVVKTTVNILTLEIIDTLSNTWFCFYLSKNKGTIQIFRSLIWINYNYFSKRKIVFIIPF